ncbi:MAG: penicillin-binding transpeptidase domain-containing protein [Clostridia bacterium]
MRKWNQNKTIKRRMVFGYIVVFLIAIGILVRLGYWQIDQRDVLLGKASSQWSLSIPIQPRRGTILDSKKRVMALNINADTIAAIPPQIEDIEYTASVLSEILEMSEEAILSRLNTDSKQIYLKRMVSDEISRQIQELNLLGIITIKESKRFYPNGSLAAQVLGFSGIDKGWTGIEYKYDESLQGTRGVISFGEESNADEKVSYTKPEDGQTLSLTIDLNIQSILEKHLKSAKSKYNAESAMAIAVDIKSGAILASSSIPSFDPNDYHDYSEVLWKNPLIEDAFEPGSTFKIITMAAALEESVLSTSDKYDCEGSIKVADKTIHCWDRQGHGLQNYYEIMQNSCNVGFIEIGKQLGASKLYDYIESFGFTGKTKVDLPSEASGIMFEKDRIGPVELATTSFGQGPAVTPIQQIMAIAAIGNNGEKMTPYVVENIKDNEGNTLYQHEKSSTKVISEETAILVREIMESVVTDGTGYRAYIEGYRIGGKTGTAQVALPQGGYDPNKFISSFIGLAPSNNPEVALFVAIKNPTTSPVNNISGGVIAAPLFGDIMKEVLRYLEVPKQITASFINETKSEYEMPDLIGKSGEVAAAQIWAIGGSIEREGPATGSVIKQTPSPGSTISPGDKIYLETQAEATDENHEVEIPNLIGLSMREAAYKLGEVGLRVEANGSGLVVSQHPQAGETVRIHTIVTIDLKARGNDRGEN